jgi:hypothetical protein
MPEITQFDTTAAAQSYSQISGVIAGFSFAVLVWLLDKQIGSRSQNQLVELLTKRALILLSMTFVANLIVSILWALISGETEANSTRPSILAFITTINFASIGPLTIEAIIFVVAATRIRRILPVFQALFFLSVFMGYFYLSITSVNLILVQNVVMGGVDSRFILADYIFMLSVTFVVFVVIVSASLYLSSLSSFQKWIQKDIVFEIALYSWLFLIFGSAVMFGFITLGDVNQIISINWILIGNILWSILIGFSIALLPKNTLYYSSELDHAFLNQLLSEKVS